MFINGSECPKCFFSTIFRKDSTRLGQKYSRGIALEVIPLAYVPVMNKVRKMFGGSIECRMAKNKAVCRSSNDFTPLEFMSRHKRSNAPSIRTPAVDQERMRPGHWLGSVFCVPFSAVDDRKDIRPLKRPAPLIHEGDLPAG